MKHEAPCSLTSLGLGAICSIAGFHNICRSRVNAVTSSGKIGRTNDPRAAQRPRQIARRLHKMRCTMKGILQTPTSHRATVLMLLAFVSAAVTPAWSQTYPARSVKLATQGAAGSGPDVVARLVTDQLARIWGQ